MSASTFIDMRMIRRAYIRCMEKYPRWLKGHPWKGCRSLIAARGFKSLLLRLIFYLFTEEIKSNKTFQSDQKAVIAGLVT